MQKALFIGSVWPEPKTTAAGHRIMQLLKAFSDQDFEITFATTASKTSYSENLEELRIHTQAIILNDSSFDVFVIDLNPDVVIFDRFMVEEQFGWRVAESTPDAIRILNTEDLHSLRNSRQQAHQKGEEFTINSWLKNDLTKREIASIFRSDLSLLVSTFEMKLLQEELNISSNLLYHLPFLLEKTTKKRQKAWVEFEERKDFICFGNGKHAPNVDALKYLKSEIWPLIRKQLPNAMLNIYGAYLPQLVNEMHNPNEGFLVHGWVEDLDAVLQKSRINLAPLRFGAGIKGKLTQAMQNGTPSITTLLGVEGMHGHLNWAGEIAQNAAEFAQKALNLFKNKEKWNEKQENGIDIINELYSKNSLIPPFFHALEKLKVNLPLHRNHNFIGAMLQHHSMASTKFMSKWIEGKNQITKN